RGSEQAEKSCDRQPSNVLLHAPASLSPGSDRRFGMHVEEMQALRVQRETQTIVDLGANIRLDGSDHRVGSRRYIQQDLRAELLDDFDHDVEAELGRIGRRGYVQILGPDPQSDVLSDIPA